MTQHIVFLLLGLSAGAVYASLGLALVINYRSSGVVNFATAAMALVTAYWYAFLRQGQLLVLVPGLPKTVRLADRLSFLPAAAIALAMSALLGLLIYAFALRPLRHAPPANRAVATIGLWVLLVGLILVRVGTTPVAVRPIFPDGAFHFGGARVAADRLWFAFTVIVISVVLGAAYKFTRFGLHTRAVADTEKGAAVSGIRPDRIAGLNWMISAVVAGIAGILIAPIVPLGPGAYTLFIVPALAAAILGQFRYAWLAVVGGLMIGMVQSEIQLLKSTYDWLPQTGLSEVVPLVLILAVLVVRAKPLPSRGLLVQQSLGRAPRPRTLAMPTLIGVAAASAAAILFSGIYRAGLLVSLIFSIIALSLVVVTGYAGQVSLAQLTLAGVAGFLLSPMTVDWGIPFPIAPVLAALGAAAVGVIVGLPALRIRGLAVAVVTLGLAGALQTFWFQNADFVPVAGKDIKGPELFGLNLQSRDGIHTRLAFCFLVIFVLALAALGVAVLRRSRLGASMLAVRTNERAAAAAGIAVVKTKVAAFAIAAFIAGIGGAMLAYKQQNVTFDSYDAILGITLFAFVYLGGITSVSGALFAGLMVPNGLMANAVEEWLHLGPWFHVLGGLGVIINIRQHPEGVVGSIHKAVERHRARKMVTTPVTDVAAVAVDADLDAIGLLQVRGDGRPLLSLASLTVRYGGVVAVNEVTLTVAQGDIVGLIGPNGAGKTTLIDAVSGFVPSTGSIDLDDCRLNSLPPHARSRAGLGRTFQSLELWDDLSVVENISAGLAAAKDLPRGTLHERVSVILGLLELTPFAERPAGDLSQGHRQLVSIGRALIGQPRLLLLDEPSGGLDTTESRWLADRLRSIRRSGVTIILIDHDMSFVLNLCDQIHVLDFGRIIASGSPSEVSKDRRVLDAYLGSTHQVDEAVSA